MANMSNLSLCQYIKTPHIPWELTTLWQTPDEFMEVREGREKQKEGRGEEERTERDRDGKMGEGKENGKQGVGVFSHF